MIKKQQEEKEAQLLEPSHLRAMDTVAMPYPARTGLAFTTTSRKPFLSHLSNVYL